MNTYNTNAINPEFDGPPAHLLVVEDDPDSCDMLTRRLQRAGYQVTAVMDGQSAIDTLEAGIIDLVVLDVMLPKVNGIDVLRHIRRYWHPTELPVIMATSLNESANIVQALEIGANDYVTKPIDFPVAVARIRTQLLLRQTIQAYTNANLELQRLTVLDVLTEVANRRYFHERVERALEEAVESATPLSILLVDINRLHIINETYGHNAGDEVLRMLASQLLLLVPDEVGLVARYDGDAFAIMLPQTDAAACASLQAILEARIAQTAFYVDLTSPGIEITCRFATATLTPETAVTLDVLLRSVDHDLHLQKKRRRKPRVHPSEIDARKA